MKRRRPEASRTVNKQIEQIRKVMRQVQNQTGCATSTLDLCLRLLHPFLKGVEHVDPVNMKMPRRRPQSPLKLQLHGCVGCNNHVFGPKCHLTHCPKCNFPRNDSEGNPNEVQWLGFLLISLLFCPIRLPCFVFAGLLVFPSEGANWTVN